MILVEDLSPDVIEVLGSHFDIDPKFFLAQISTASKDSGNGRWVNTLGTEVRSDAGSFVSFPYVRPWIFGLPEDPEGATTAIESFNVTRNITRGKWFVREFRSRIDIVQSQASIWMSKTADVSILVVDPTIHEGRPLWPSHMLYENTLSMKETIFASSPPKPSKNDLFDTLMKEYAASDLDIETARKEPKIVALPILKSIAEDWFTTFNYVSSRVDHIERQMRLPGDDDLDHPSLSELSSLIEDIGHYETLLAGTVPQLCSEDFRPPSDHKFIQYLTNPINKPKTAELRTVYFDLVQLQTLMKTLRERAERLESRNVSKIALKQSRQTLLATRQASLRGDTRLLTILAIIYLPPLLISSMFGITFDVSGSRPWIFFAAAVPLVIVTLATAMTWKAQEDRKSTTLEVKGRVEEREVSGFRMRNSASLDR
jgi:Mg2+ and Co2+ transporter CorA